MKEVVITTQNVAFHNSQHIIINPLIVVITTQNVAFHNDTDV